MTRQPGAETALLTADRIGETIVEYARSHNAAQIVIGRSRGVRLRLRGNLAQWLFSHARDFEITVVGEAAIKAVSAEDGHGTSIEVILLAGSELNGINDTSA